MIFAFYPVVDFIIIRESKNSKNQSEDENFSK